MLPEEQNLCSPFNFLKLAFSTENSHKTAHLLHILNTGFHAMKKNSATRYEMTFSFQ